MDSNNLAACILQNLHWQQMSWGNFGRICNPSVLQARQHAETKEATKIAIFTAMYCFDKH
jgi:hypothetical protein